MYTEDEVFSLRDRLTKEGAGKPEIVRRVAWACVGWPYVFGAAGEMCTPEIRRKFAVYHPEYADNIRRACPVLSGNKSSCDGCQWQRCRCFDCRGFTRWLLAMAGLDLAGAGATSQWETAANWAASGAIETIPDGLVCCVFKRKDGKMSHTGMHMGGGEIVHCSTTVKADALPGRPAWTHWGVPAGLYTVDELRAAGLDVDPARNVPTLRKGVEGEMVKTLQMMLNDETGAELAVDGIFGAKTEAAVIHFQALHDLTEDGIVGPKTWAALGVSSGDFDEEPDAPEEPAQPDQPGVWIALEDWQAVKAAFAAVGSVLKKYE